MDKIKVGIIGTGFIGPAHIEALRRISFVEVKALADIDDATAKEKAELLGISESYGDYKNLIKDESINAVHICTPNFLHYQMVKDALNAGKHVLCEKPLALTVGQARELVDLAEEKHLANAVGFNLRYYPMVQQVKSMVAVGELGEIFAVNGSYQQDWLLYETDYNWRIDPTMSGDSRAIADIGSHWLDMIEYIMDKQIASVCSDFATFHQTRKKPLKAIETYSGKMEKSDAFENVAIHTEDYASVLLNFEKGVHGSVTVNQTAAGRKNRIYFEIYGSKKSVAWCGERPNELWIGSRDNANHVMLKDPALVDDKVKQFIGFPGGHNEGFPDTTKQLFKLFYDFIKNDCYLGGEAPEHPTFKDGLRELIIGEKVVESAKKRKWVNIS